MKHSPNQTNSDQRMFLKLLDSPLLATYRRAFVNATGMSLELVPLDGDARKCHRPNDLQGSFCQLVNKLEGSRGCLGCERACQQLWESAGEQSKTATCFAGLRETAIPVRAGQTTVALLTTGQVFTSPPDEASFETIEKDLGTFGLSKKDIKSLREAWSDTRVMSVDQYEGTITLLAAFALQLSDLFNRLLLEEANQDPDVVVHAKRYINANLEDKICLQDLADYVGVSTFYFCKIFKRSTGLTLTEYINRRRIERVKKRLLNPQARVTEVAYDVGYQSLSQFNRSFLKYVGISPTKFRKKHLDPSQSKDLHAA